MQQYDQYIDQYNDFLDKNILGKRFILRANATVYSSKNFRILKYNCSANFEDKVILVVPSLFNSPEILFLGKTTNLVNELQKLGTVYLIHWLEIKDHNYSLDDYVLELTAAIEILNNHSKKLINLVGHCIGGNLAIAATVIKSSLVKTLTLLTTPWDFSHFNSCYQVQQYLDLDKNIESLSVIPKIYTQILFFLLSPEYFETKIDRYFALNLNEDKQLFFEVEHWLMSGNNLPAATYFQLTREFITANTQARMLWSINGNIINPKQITIPVNQIIAREDKIVPMQSILVLHQNLKHSTILQVEGGHISYLLKGAGSEFFSKYKSWFERQ